MSNINNPDYLKNIQYKDSRNLSARADLHERFSTNKIGWHIWVFQQLQIPNGSRILEIGCGPAYLWQKAKQQVNEGWLIFLSDLSGGMLEEARAGLRGLSRYTYTILDGAWLPFPASFFDAVIANHVLYHLPLVTPALREIHRVLKSGGCLYAATNGDNHLREISQWKNQFMPQDSRTEWGTRTTSFSLDNGAEQLKQFFNPVRLRLYPDHMEINQVDPVLRYIESYLDIEDSQQPLARLRTYLEELLAEKGSIKVSKETGLFLAIKP